MVNFTILWSLFTFIFQKFQNHLKIDCHIAFLSLNDITLMISHTSFSPCIMCFKLFLLFFSYIMVSYQNFLIQAALCVKDILTPLSYRFNTSMKLMLSTGKCFPTVAPSVPLLKKKMGKSSIKIDAILVTSVRNITATRRGISNIWLYIQKWYVIILKRRVCYTYNLHHMGQVNCGISP